MLENADKIPDLSAHITDELDRSTNANASLQEQVASTHTELEEHKILLRNAVTERDELRTLANSSDVELPDRTDINEEVMAALQAIEAAATDRRGEIPKEAISVLTNKIETGRERLAKRNEVIEVSTPDRPLTFYNLAPHTNAKPSHTPAVNNNIPSYPKSPANSMQSSARNSIRSSRLFVTPEVLSQIEKETPADDETWPF